MKPSTALLGLLASSAPLVSGAAVKRSVKSFNKRQTTVDTNNYAGAGLTPPPDGTTFNHITAQINVPQTYYVPDHSTPPTVQRSAAWIGFGPTPGNAISGGSGIIQTGCGFLNNGQGSAPVRCWYEFFPSPPVFFSGFSPAVGDTIQLDIYRNSGTSGKAVVTDLSSGASVSATFGAPSGHSVAGQIANWIVEDPAVNGGYAPLDDFSQVTFAACAATTSGGNTYGPTDGSYKVYSMASSGVQQAQASFPGASQVQVDYVGQSGTSS